MESHLGVLPLQHLECKYILREKQRVEVWQVDLSGIRITVKKKKRKQCDSSEGANQLDEEFL